MYLHALTAGLTLTLDPHTPPLVAGFTRTAGEQWLAPPFVTSRLRGAVEKEGTLGQSGAGGAGAVSQGVGAGGEGALEGGAPTGLQGVGLGGGGSMFGGAAPVLQQPPLASLFASEGQHTLSGGGGMEGWPGAGGVGVARPLFSLAGMGGAGVGGAGGTPLQPPSAQDMRLMKRPRTNAWL